MHTPSAPAPRFARCVPVEHLEQRRLLSGGEPDPSFGAGGQAFAPAEPGLRGGDVLALPDGKVLLAGTAGTWDSGDAFTVYKFNADGTPDATFNAGSLTPGLAQVDFTGGPDTLYSAALQSDGKILLVGETGVQFAIGVARLNPDGTPDPTFGSAGKLMLSPSWSSFATSVLVQDDGRLLVGGTAVGFDDVGDFCVYRLTPDGQPDPTWGNNGLITQSFGNRDNLSGLAIDAEGRVLAYGMSGFQGTGAQTRRILARYDASGAPDLSFGYGGYVADDAEPWLPSAPARLTRGVAVQADGKILVNYAREVDGRPAVERYLPDGRRDEFFGMLGTAVGLPAEGEPWWDADMALQPDGRILLAGTTGDAWDPHVAVTLLDRDGWAVQSFGVGGCASPPLGAGFEKARAMALAADGAILLNTEGGVARLLGEPLPDGVRFVQDYDDVPEGTFLEFNAAWGGPLEDPGTYYWSIFINGVLRGGAVGGNYFGLRFDDEGEYTAQVSATDSAGTTSTDSQTITVHGIDPSAQFQALGTGEEGQPAHVQFYDVTDPSLADQAAGFRFAFDFNNDGDFTDPGDVADTADASASHAFSDDGVYTVRGRVTDKDGRFTDYTTDVTVLNAAPTVAVAAPAEARKRRPVTFVLSAADPSAADTAAGFTFRIDWDGDSIVDEIFQGASGASITHEFSRAGTYAVQVWAVDRDGGTSSPAVHVIHVR